MSESNPLAAGFVPYVVWVCVKTTSGRSEVMVELDIRIVIIRQEIQTLKNRRDCFEYG